MKYITKLGYIYSQYDQIRIICYIFGSFVEAFCFCTCILIGIIYNIF